MNQIVTKTNYNKDAHKKLYMFTMFRKSFSMYFMVILLAAVAFFMIRSAINSKEPEHLTMSITMVAMLAVITPLIMLSRTNSNLRKDEEARKGILETIIINKEKLSRKLDGNSSVVISWKQVESVYERKDYFFFFLNGDQSLIVEKSKFVEGDSEVLMKLIEKYGPKNKKGKSVLKRLKVKK